MRPPYLGIVTDGDVLAASLFQRFAHTVFGKSRIARFSCQEKSVIGYATESLPVKHGVIPARQTVHSLPRKECGERAEQDRQLEHDREKRRNDPKIPRLTVHIEPIAAPRRAKVDEGSGKQTGNPAKQNPAAQPC